jgi:hypothetical protein
VEQPVSPTGHPNPKPRKRRGPYALSDGERQRRREAMVRQREAGVMGKRTPVEDMDDGEVRAFIEHAAEKLGLTVDEAARRYLQDPPEPANSTPDSTPDTTPYSPRIDESTAPPSMVSSDATDDDPFPDDPALASSFAQLKRETSSQVSEDELQAARAFGARYESTPLHASPHETQLLVERIRRAYRER